MRARNLPSPTASTKGETGSGTLTHEAAIQRAIHAIRIENERGGTAATLDLRDVGEVRAVADVLMVAGVRVDGIEIRPHEPVELKVSWLVLAPDFGT